MTYSQLLGEQQECECDIGTGSTEFHRGVIENYNVKQYPALSDLPWPGCESVRLYQSFNSAYPKMNKGCERQLAKVSTRLCCAHGYAFHSIVQAPSQK
jgi:hypothetical protein